MAITYFPGEPVKKTRKKKPVPCCRAQAIARKLANRQAPNSTCNHDSDENLLIIPLAELERVYIRAKQLQLNEEQNAYVGCMFGLCENDQNTNPKEKLTIILFPVVKRDKPDGTFRDYNFYGEDWRKDFYIQQTWIDPSTIRHNSGEAVEHFFGCNGGC